MTNINSTNIKGIISSVISEEMEDRHYPLTTTRIVELTAWRMGIDTVGERTDRIFTSDREGTWLSWAGCQLVTATRCYDWENPTGVRLSSRPCGEGEELVQWGSPHYEYVGVAPVEPRLDDDLVEAVHLEVWRLTPGLIAEAIEKQAAAAKAWGLQMNLALTAAGCSQAEVQAWWSLQWKREWAPAQWAALCRDTDTQTVAWALAAHSGRYLDAIGAFVGASFPRSMDAIHGLARAKGITRGVKKPFWNTPADEVPPTTVRGGAKVWSF